MLHVFAREVWWSMIYNRSASELKTILTYWYDLLSKLQKEKKMLSSKSFRWLRCLYTLTLHWNDRLLFAVDICWPFRHTVKIRAQMPQQLQINGSSTDTGVKQVPMHEPYHALPLGIKAYTEHNKLSLASLKGVILGASILQTSKVEHGDAWSYKSYMLWPWLSVATIGYFCASTIGASCDRLCGTSGSNSREELWRGPGSPEGSWWRHHDVSMTLIISCILLNHSPILLQVTCRWLQVYAQKFISDTIFELSLADFWPMEGKEGLLWWHATSIYQLSMLHLLHLRKLARWRWEWFLSWPLQEVMSMTRFPS